MTTKKLYSAPTIEIMKIESTPILAGSNFSDMDKEGDPFAAPSEQQLSSASYFDVWDDAENE